MCFWVWLGDEWSSDGDSCPEGCGCSTPPVNPGTFIGQRGTSQCDCP